jgi:hypothetical protein
MKTTGKFYTTRRYRDANEQCEPTLSANRMTSVVNLDFGKPGMAEFIRFEMTKEEARELSASLAQMAACLDA